MLKIVAASVLGLFAVLGGAFLVGSAADDPGGASGVALIVLWLVPLLAGSLLAWARPRAAAWVLGVLAVVILGLVVWSALDADPWRRLEDQHGPVLAVALFSLAVPVGVLAWHRPVLGGSMLVALAAVPVVSVLVLAAAGRFTTGGMPPQAGLSVMVAPLLLVGLLDVLAGLAGDEPSDADVGGPSSSAPADGAPGGQDP